MLLLTFTFIRIALLFHVVWLETWFSSLRMKIEGAFHIYVVRMDSFKFY